MGGGDKRRGRIEMEWGMYWNGGEEYYNGDFGWRGYEDEGLKKDMGWK